MIPTRTHSQKTSSDGLDVGLEVGSIVLKTLETVTKEYPLPGLSEAANVALHILDIVKTVRSNLEGFKQLGADASQLVYIIICAYQAISDDDQDDPNLIANLARVLEVLNNIEEFANKGATRNRFVAFWQSSVDAGKITEHREKLQQCLNKFGFESETSIRVTVVKLAVQHEKLMHILESRNPKENGDTTVVETNEVTNRTNQAEKEVGVYRDLGSQRDTISIARSRCKLLRSGGDCNRK